jgi:hypothetical protein
MSYSDSEVSVEELEGSGYDMESYSYQERYEIE